jgi:tetratricopeptide (TPR) repeat protein
MDANFVMLVMGVLVGMVVVLVGVVGFLLGKRSHVSALPAVPAQTSVTADEPDADVDTAEDLAVGEFDEPEAELEEPAEPATPEAPSVVDESRNMEEYARELASSDEPIRELKRLVRDTKKRNEETGHQADAISEYLARGLEEAGINDADAKLPPVEVVLPQRSHTIFLRAPKSGVEDRELRRVIAIEGALNRTLFAWEGLVKEGPHSKGTPAGIEAAAGAEATVAGEDACQPREEAAEVPLERLSVDECYAFNQGLATSITAQMGSSPISRASMLDVLGEWGVRQTFSAGLESFRLPLRVTARYRLNLMGGDIAIELPFVPASCQPGSIYSTELGRVVPASHQMREQMATDYALRCAILMAAHAFRCSKRLCHAFVAVVHTGRGRACLVSGDISREMLREHDLSQPFDARELARELGVRFNLENDRLVGTDQGFSLESERFCPASRYEVVDLSKRVLPSFEGELLGAERVSDLAINEDAHRVEVAEQIACGLMPSVERSVRRVLNLSQNDTDPTVREAGKRCAAAMIDGSLPENDALSFTEEFVSGDALSRANDRALELVSAGHAREAVDVLTDALAPIDALDVYADGDDFVYRNFTSYVGRTLYNRLEPADGREVRLVPDAYFGAQLIMASALITLGRANEALGFARRAQDLNPYDMSGAMRVVRALEMAGDLEGAASELRRYLERAFDPQSVGMAYYRLAFMEWKLGNTELADACYQKALVSRASCSFMAQVELMAMRAQTGSEVEPDEVENVISQAGVPLAPTERVLEVLVEAAQGATDAEVFPVARSFANLLGALSCDDVMHGVASSIEHEPDR